MTNEIKTWQERMREDDEPAGFRHTERRYIDAEIAELRAKVESLAADAERLDYVAECANFNKSFGYINVGFNVDSADGDLRKAIDMAKERA